LGQHYRNYGTGFFICDLVVVKLPSERLTKQKNKAAELMTIVEPLR
jgi:hypothetical protein